MNESMLLSVLKPFLPKLKGYLIKGEKSLREYIESIPLNEGETHIAAFTEINEETVYMVLGAFNNKTFVRFIEAKPLTKWIDELIQKAL